MKAVPKDGFYDFIGRVDDTPGKTSSVLEIQATFSGSLKHPSCDSRIPSNLRPAGFREAGHHYPEISEIPVIFPAVAIQSGGVVAI